MIEWLRVLFFSSVIQITPGLVDFGVGAHEIRPRESVSAITGGAHLMVDVTSMIPPGQRDLHSARAWVEGNIPCGSISAQAYPKNAQKAVVFRYCDVVSWSNGDVRLLLRSNDDVPTGVEYFRFSMTTKVPFRGVRVYWSNFSK